MARQLFGYSFAQKRDDAEIETRWGLLEAGTKLILRNRARTIIGIVNGGAS